MIRIGDWPDELVTPPKKKKFVEDDSRYIKSAIDWAASDAEPEDEEEMKIIRELLDEL